MAQAGNSVTQEVLRGWPRLATSFLGVSLGVTAIFFYTQGVFFRPLQAEFGWSRSEISLASTAFALALACASPLCGLAVDRFGVRTVACSSIVGLAACFWGLSAMQGQLEVAVTLFVATALLGVGTSAVTYVRLVASWFVRVRGLAIGLTMVGTGVAATIAPAFVATYVDHYGWRAAYGILALIALAPLPFVLVWGQDRIRSGNADHSVPGVGFAQAARMPRFWMMGLTFAFAGCAIAGLIPHLPPMMQDSGAAPARVGEAMGAMGLAIIAGRVLTGLALDRIFAPLIAAAVLIAAASGCVGLALLGADFGIVGAALIGLAMGSEIDLAGYMSARYFGLKAHGAIFGLQYGLFSLGGACGPIAAGLLYDRFGDYRIALFGAAGVLLVGIPLVLALGRYPPETRPSST